MFRILSYFLVVILSLQIPFYIWLLFCKLSRKKVYSLVFITSLVLVCFGMIRILFISDYPGLEDGGELIELIVGFFELVFLYAVLVAGIIYPLVFYVMYELMHRPKIEGIDNSNSSINTWEQHLRAINVYIIALCAWLGLLMYSLFNTLAWLPSGKVSILIALTILCLCVSILVRDRIKSRNESFHIVFIILDLIIMFLVFYAIS